MKYKVALAGNPNVGKSTVFNNLTGLKQHTGNWPGKTVSNASGTYFYKKEEYVLYDLPGTYSLISHSKEEEVARDFICFEEVDATVVVCDAVCLERNLNLVLQILEITDKVVICVNLLDEAKKKKINIDLKQLSKQLGVPVVGTSARSGNGIKELQDAVSLVVHKKIKTNPCKVNYSVLESSIENITKILNKKEIGIINKRWLSLKLLDTDKILEESLNKYLKYNLLDDIEIKQVLLEEKNKLLGNDCIINELKDVVVSIIIHKTEEISSKVVIYEQKNYAKRDRKIDKFLTSRITGIPMMLLLVGIVFWLTIVGASYPSNWLFNLLFWLGDKIETALIFINTPDIIIEIFISGIYRVLAWVIAVMLPPMAIFFPLFTILEDSGYLTRIAFNLDNCFKKCSACGKQALTMCMGFGCNAAGVTGCRIIDSPRERLIAIITNNFVPCNGRFPTIISILTMFFIGFSTQIVSSLFEVLLLILIILFGILMTFTISKILSKTILKGVPSSFTLELPPYRRPQICKSIIHSIFDRTIFVLGRAIAIAAPAGLLIWLMANLKIGNLSILKHCSNFLDPFANLIGLDGVILISFILGFPANEIVIPIMIMVYMSTGTITEFNNLTELKKLLINNNWSWLTAICTVLFSLFHFPCSTTCLTIKKETNSYKWTFLSMIIPTLVGIVICFTLTTIVRLLGLV